MLDPVVFCKYFLPDLFSGDIPALHIGLWCILTKQTDFALNYADPQWLVENFVFQRGDKTYSIFEYRDGRLILHTELNTLYMLPRGFSKTTICGAAYGLYDILYMISGVQLYVSQSGPHSEAQAQTIQRQLESNEKVLSIFGNIKPKINEGRKWTDALFETTTGQVFVARGAGSQIRGQVYLGKRPRRVTFDDLEDSDTVKSDTQRQDLKRWAYADLFPVIEEMDTSSEILGLGTLLHNDSLLATIQADPSWTVVKFGARDKRGQLLWARKMSEEKLESKKISYALMGRVDLYYMEYFNEVHAIEGSPFRREFFQYGQPSDQSELDVAVFMDPAISEKRTADSSVITVAGMSRKSGKIFVLDEWGKRGATPRECLDKYFEFVRKWKSRRKNGVESNAYQKAFVHILREEMFRQKYYFEVEGIPSSTSNLERILGILQPRYASGYVVHTRVFPELETELLDIRVAAHDDRATALAGAVALLDPFAASAASGQDLGEDEYEPLDQIGGAP
jgi:hypothetical protein